MSINKVIKRLRGHESGQALFLALLLLGVGSLVLAPLLSFMGSGLNAGVVVEDKTDELYAADAGVQDAIWKINNLPDSLPPPHALEIVGQTYEYSLWDINNIEVIEVEIELHDMANSGTYRVTSTADETEIVAFIATVWLDFSGITDNVITSQGVIDFPPHWEGMVNPSSGEHGPVEGYDDPWPTPQDLITWYSRDVDKDNPYPSGTIELDGVDLELGPIYRDGTLEILNSSNTLATLTLTGTIYITGDTLIGVHGKQDKLNVDLNGHTIFVESDSADPQKALEIGSRCYFTGPGVVIAVGDIFFKPNIEAGMTEPIFIMSVSGTTTLQPGGDFYGAVAGSVEVDLQPGTSINYPEGGFGDINFPGGGSGGEMVWGIHSWIINMDIY